MSCFPPAPSLQTRGRWGVQRSCCNAGRASSATAKCQKNKRSRVPWASSWKLSTSCRDSKIMQRWPKHVSVPTNLGRCYHPALAVLGDEGGLMGVIARTTRQVTARTGGGGGRRRRSTLPLVTYSGVTAHADAIECSVLFPPPILLYQHSFQLLGCVKKSTEFRERTYQNMSLLS